MSIDQPSYRNESEMQGSIMTGIPIVDIIINIDLFTAHFEHRNKILTIVKELFNHCNSMKKLLLAHHKVILTNLMEKYDKKCMLYESIQSKSSVPAADQRRSSQLENRDEFLAVNIG